MAGVEFTKIMKKSRYEVKIFWIYIAASMLIFLELPQKLSWLNFTPLVVVILWNATFSSDYPNLGIVWILGLMLDLLVGRYIGVHCLLMLVSIYGLDSFRKHIINCGFIQRAGVIFINLILYQLVIFFTQNSFDQYFRIGEIIEAAMIGILIWSILEWLLPSSRYR